MGYIVIRNMKIIILPDFDSALYSEVHPADLFSA